MKTLLTLISFLPLITLAQGSISPYVLSAGGNAPNVYAGATTMAFTIGEPFTHTAEEGGGDELLITQGFHQPIDSVKETVSEDETLYNAFSPNGDGVNDVWRFRSPYATEEYQIKIYSRWGNIVWDNKDNNEVYEWNGTNYNEEDVPDGTYYYNLYVGGKLTKSGMIEITR